MLTSPLSLESIQSMLIFSMWNLIPGKDIEHLDPWLLSGVAGMQGMWAINFEQLLNRRTHGLVDPNLRETLRSWNFMSLPPSVSQCQERQIIAELQSIGLKRLNCRSSEEQEK